MRPWNHRCSPLTPKNARAGDYPARSGRKGMNRVPPIDSVERVGELGSRDVDKATVGDGQMKRPFSSLLA